VSLDELRAQGLDVEDSSSHQVVWLKNIDRLMDMTPIWFNPKDYILLDAGCGVGISTHYFLYTYSFKEVSGFDFSPELIKYAQTNILHYSVRCQGVKSVEFLVQDARVFELRDAPNFIFMFNPFGFETASKFILNNVSKLKRNKCLIAIANDVWIEKLVGMGLHEHVYRDSFNNLTLLLY
jgi:SAM-dependent methyltransferase